MAGRGGGGRRWGGGGGAHDGDGEGVSAVRVGVPQQHDHVPQRQLPALARAAPPPRAAAAAAGRPAVARSAGEEGCARACV